MKETNKETELLEMIHEIKKKNYISINDFEFLQDKIGEVIMRKNQQLEEAKESRDNWKSKYMKLKVIKDNLKKEFKNEDGSKK